MAPVRIRLGLAPDVPLGLAQARVALVSYLHAHSLDGVLVASVDNRAALEDLEWLGIEPDAMVSAARQSRYDEAAQQLVDAGLAYPCYCASAELRELPVAPPGSPDPIVYDGRCRHLTAKDRKALHKTGRKASIRLIRGDSQVQAQTADGRSWGSLPSYDFRLTLPGGVPMPAFAAVVDSHAARVSHVVLGASAAHDLSIRALIGQALGYAQPTWVVLDDWPGVESAPQISTLRDRGFHPLALLRFLAHVGWDPAGATDLAEMAARFSLADLGAPAVLDLDSLARASLEVLRDLPPAQQVHVVVEHLTRRGYGIAERELAWQRAFTRAAVPMGSMAEVEQLARLVLSPTVDYGRDVASTLRRPLTIEIIERFLPLLPESEGAGSAEWTETLRALRDQVSTPGRAQAILRLMLTGERDGPSLLTLLVLLGPARCRARLDKARRYAS